MVYDKVGALRRWRHANPEKVSAQKRTARLRNLEKARAAGIASSLRCRYGITVEQKNAMIAERNGKCDICNEPCDIYCVDHIHGTNPPIVRGILCSGCNLGIGRLGEDIDRLLSAVHYLIKRGETKWNKALLNSQPKTNSQ